MNAIFDRTSEDIKVANELIERIRDEGYENLSSEQKHLWDNGLKGFLNFTDMNRIEKNIKLLSDFFKLGLSVKTDWAVADYPTASAFKRVRGNIITIRALNYVNALTPYTPSLPFNTYEKINDIERILVDTFYGYVDRYCDATCYADNELYIDEEIGDI